jgi:hypothetical protein
MCYRSCVSWENADRGYDNYCGISAVSHVTVLVSSVIRVDSLGAASSR